MTERIEFQFDGQLATDHLMDFYEAGRFQYGAARLLVKLDQFRRTGRFSEKITYQNNTRITLASQEPGSFIIAALAPMAGAIAEAFVTAPISLMWSYVVDRIVKPTNEDNIRHALATNRGLIDLYQADIAGREDQARRTMALLGDRIAKGDELTQENQELYERLIAETERRAYLEGEAEGLRRISIEQDTKLISMAAPLLKDMGVSLRSSATKLEISTEQDGVRRRIMFLNRQMASEIETSIIDQESTLILVKTVQYNRETGWGKIRMEEHAGLLSFNVPSDRKAELLRALTAAMNEDQTYIECVFVRSPRGVRQRAIILAVHDIDKFE